jgi:group I intron endonuclease
MDKIFYNYITTNIINNKQYIGTHSTINIDDGYLGSGNIILRSIKKYGKHNFKREILCYCETEQEAFDNESKFIEQYKTLSPNGYNISPKGGLGYIGSLSKESIEKMRKSKLGIYPSEETRKKMSEKSKGRIKSKETLLKMSNAFKGRIISDEWRKKISVTLMGKTQSKETILKRSNSMRGKITSQETKDKISESLKGHVVSIETREKISKYNIGKKQKTIICPYCNKIGAGYFMRHFHFDNCKFK